MKIEYEISPLDNALSDLAAVCPQEWQSTFQAVADNILKRMPDWCRPGDSYHYGMGRNRTYEQWLDTLEKQARRQEVRAVENRFVEYCWNAAQETILHMDAFHHCDLRPAFGAFRQKKWEKQLASDLGQIDKQTDKFLDEALPLAKQDSIDSPIYVQTMISLLKDQEIKAWTQRISAAAGGLGSDHYRVWSEAGQELTTKHGPDSEVRKYKRFNLERTVDYVNGLRSSMENQWLDCAFEQVNRSIGAIDSCVPRHVVAAIVHKIVESEHL
jgi:hypothetical protein